MLIGTASTESREPGRTLSALPGLGERGGIASSSCLIFIAKIGKNLIKYTNFYLMKTDGNKPFIV